MNSTATGIDLSRMAAIMIIVVSFGAIGCQLGNLDPKPSDHRSPVFLTRVQFSDANNGTVVGSDGTILHTTDAGGLWVRQYSNTSYVLYGLCFIDAAVGTAVGGNTNGGNSGVILRTTDGGSTWALQLIASSVLHGVSFSDINTGIAVGENGLMLRTTNGGKNWIEHSPGTPNTLLTAVFADADTAIVVGRSGTVLRSTDRGVSWLAITDISVGVDIRDLSFLHGRFGMMGGHNYYDGYIYRTTDAGRTWVPDGGGSNSVINAICLSDDSAATTVGYNADPSGGNVLSSLLMTTNTTDGIWLRHEVMKDTALNGVWYTDRLNGFAVGTAGTILHTTDAGATWVRQHSGVGQ